MWSIPLTGNINPVPSKKLFINVFDENGGNLLPILMIRDYRDENFAYCAVN